jgi:uncharacterized protein YdaU (DUF1376 family)
MANTHKRLDWVPLDPSAFRRDTETMDPVQFTVYTRLVLEYLADGPLLNSPTRLRGVVGIEEIDAKIDDVLQEWFELHEDGRWHHAEWDALLEAQRAKYRSYVEHGKRGADKRWRRNGDPNGDPISKKGEENTFGKVQRLSDEEYDAEGHPRSPLGTRNASRLEERDGNRSGSLPATPSTLKDCNVCGVRSLILWPDGRCKRCYSEDRKPGELPGSLRRGAAKGSASGASQGRVETTRRVSLRAGAGQLHTALD